MPNDMTLTNVAYRNLPATDVASPKCDKCTLVVEIDIWSILQ